MADYINGMYRWLRSRTARIWHLSTDGVHAVCGDPVATHVFQEPLGDHLPAYRCQKCLALIRQQLGL